MVLQVEILRIFPDLPRKKIPSFKHLTHFHMRNWLTYGKNAVNVTAPAISLQYHFSQLREIAKFDTFQILGEEVRVDSRGNEYTSTDYFCAGENPLDRFHVGPILRMSSRALDGILAKLAPEARDKSRLPIPYVTDGQSQFRLYRVTQPRAKQARCIEAVIVKAFAVAQVIDPEKSDFAFPDANAMQEAADRKSRERTSGSHRPSADRQSRGKGTHPKARRPITNELVG